MTFDDDCRLTYILYGSTCTLCDVNKFQGFIFTQTTLLQHAWYTITKKVYNSNLRITTIYAKSRTFGWRAVFIKCSPLYSGPLYSGPLYSLSYNPISSGYVFGSISCLCCRCPLHQTVWLFSRLTGSVCSVVGPLLLFCLHHVCLFSCQTENNDRIKFDDRSLPFSCKTTNADSEQ